MRLVKSKYHLIYHFFFLTYKTLFEIQYFYLAREINMSYNEFLIMPTNLRISLINDISRKNSKTAKELKLNNI